MKPLTTRSTTPAVLTATITCHRCRTRDSFCVAAASGWRYDPHGPAFVAYYCPTCCGVIDEATP